VSTQQSTSLSDDLVQFIASDVAVGSDALDASTDLVMTGLIDSLGVMMVVDWLEQRLDIAIDPNDVVIEHFESVDAIVGYLRGRDDCRFE
jgi:acyl carrier protein